VARARRRAGLALMVTTLATFTSAASGQGDGDEPAWRADSRAARSAREAGDTLAYRRHLEALYHGLDDNPLVAYQLAGVSAQLGDTDEAVRWLRLVAAAGVAPSDAATDTTFRSLHGLAAYDSILARMTRNRTPVTRSESAFTLSDSALLTEDIAFDSARSAFYLSSVHRRKVVSRDSRGRVSDLIAPGRDSLWGVMALGLDARRRVLWVSAAAIPESEGYAAADSGRSAVYAFNLASGALLARLEPPRTSRGHVLGDMGVDKNGTVYVSDAIGGGVYRIASPSAPLEVLVPPGTLGSAQSPAPSDDGRELFVADYPRGILVIDLVGRGSRWLEHDDTVAVNGLDGLVFDRSTLIGVQNGSDPQRIVRLWLDAAHRRVVRLEVLEANTPWLTEPTHGVVVGRSYYFIANAQWDLFENGRIQAAKLKPPAVRRLALDR